LKRLRLARTLFVQVVFLKALRNKNGDGIPCQKANRPAIWCRNSLCGKRLICQLTCHLKMRVSKRGHDL
jgi:hypothetical protein